MFDIKVYYSPKKAPTKLIIAHSFTCKVVYDVKNNTWQPINTNILMLKSNLIGTIPLTKQASPAKIAELVEYHYPELFL
jgi:hypothetical protein